MLKFILIILITISCGGTYLKSKSSSIIFSRLSNNTLVKLDIPAASADQLLEAFVFLGSYVYIVTLANIYIIDLTDNSVSVLEDTNADGDDVVSGSFGFDSINNQIVYVCNISATAHKLCRAYSSNPTGPIDTVEVVSNISGNTATTDNINKTLMDATRGRFYFVSSNSFYRLTLSHSSLNKITATEELVNSSGAGSGDYISEVTNPILMENSGNIYITVCGINGGTYCHLSRVTESTDFNNKIRHIAGGGINFTRYHSNQWPGMIYADQQRELLYIKSPTSFWSQLFRVSESNNSTSQVVAGNVLTSLMSSGSNNFATLGASDSNDVVYIRSYNGTSGNYKVFRLNSGTSSSNRITTPDVLSNTNPGGSDGISSTNSRYDSQNGVLYFRGNTPTGNKLFKIDDTSNATVDDTDALSDFVPSGSDGISNIEVFQKDGNLFYIAANPSGHKKIFFKSAAHNFTGKMTEANVGKIDSNPSGDDAPSILAFSQEQQTLFAKAVNSDGHVKLLTMSVSGNLTEEVINGESLYVNINNNMTENPKSVNILNEELSLIVADDSAGQKSMYLYKKQ